jgi:hypothetical protein
MVIAQKMEYMMKQLLAEMKAGNEEMSEMKVQIHALVCRMDAWLVGMWVSLYEETTTC